MKKKTKQLLFLAGILVLLLAGYFAMDLIPEKEEAEQNIPAEELDVTEFGVEDIVSYSYTNPSYTMGFYVTKDGYVHQEDAAFPVNEASVELQLKALGAMTAMQKIDSTDKEEYGLTRPQMTVSATLADGTERNFLIGDKALFEDAYYVLDEEKGLIYLVSADQCEEFHTVWSAMVEKENFVMVSAEQMVDVTVETDGVQTMYIAYEEALENWQLTTPEGTYAGDTAAVLEALGIFGAYSVRTTKEYNCADFAPYGLDNPKTKVTVRYKLPEGVELPESSVHGEVLTLTLELGNVEESGETYVRINGSSYVYGMSAYYAEGVSVFPVEELKKQTEENMEMAE
ncbi:MAG: DUF4340 domain-containing protein [Lachnospiraceae bacterium]|nr:DUF4340 domain-containing protein [Lachnospiraceae bacterium]